MNEPQKDQPDSLPEKASAGRNLRTMESVESVSPSPGNNFSTDKAKKIAIIVVAAILIFLLKGVIWDLLMFVLTLAVIGVIGVVGYSALQVSKDKEYQRLAAVAAQQRPFLEDNRKLYPGDVDTVLRQAQDYFLEKTWGLSGLRWRVNNVDPAVGRLVADFECTELPNHDLVPASAGYATQPVKSFGIFPSVLPSKKVAARRYVSVRMQAITQPGGGTAVEYSWDFRYSEQSDSARPAAVPEGLFAVCEDLISAMQRENS